MKQTIKHVETKTSCDNCGAKFPYNTKDLETVKKFEAVRQRLTYTDLIDNKDKTLVRSDYRHFLGRDTEIEADVETIRRRITCPVCLHPHSEYKEHYYDTAKNKRVIEDGRTYSYGDYFQRLRAERYLKEKRKSFKDRILGVFK